MKNEGFLKRIFGAVPGVSLEPSPKGIMLAGDEAKNVIERWQQETGVIEAKVEKLGIAIPDARDRVREINQEIKQEATRMAGVKKMFLKVKTPVAKNKYARLLVHSNAILTYLVGSKKLMQLNIQRAEGAIEESQAIGRLLVHKIADAEIYYKLNGQLRLVGDALAFVEMANSKTSEIEKDMEISLEGLEEIAGRYSDGDVLAEANRICAKALTGLVSE